MSRTRTRATPVVCEGTAGGGVLRRTYEGHPPAAGFGGVGCGAAPGGTSHTSGRGSGTPAAIAAAARTIARRRPSPRTVAPSLCLVMNVLSGFSGRLGRWPSLQRRLVEHRRISAEGLRRVEAHLRRESVARARIDRRP